MICDVLCVCVFVFCIGVMCSVSDLRDVCATCVCCVSD